MMEFLKVKRHPSMGMEGHLLNGELGEMEQLGRSQSLRAAPAGDVRKKLSPRKALTPRPSTRRTPRETNRKASLTAASPFNRLTVAQRFAVRASWRSLNNATTLNQLLKRLLSRLETEYPPLKEIFYKAAFINCFSKPTAGGAGGAAALSSPLSVATASSSSPCRPSLVGAMVTLNDHAALLAQFLSGVVERLEDAADLSQYVRGYGARHAALEHSCGFRSDTWEHFGETAAELICTSDGVVKLANREAQRGWRLLLACVTDELRTGFDCESRQRNGRRSSVVGIEMRRSPLEESVRRLPSEPPASPPRSTGPLRRKLSCFHNIGTTEIRVRGESSRRSSSKNITTNNDEVEVLIRGMTKGFL